MKILQAIILFFSFVIISQAQVTFQKTIGGSGSDAGKSVCQTNDGGYIIAGSTESFGAGDFDIYLIKTDTHGNIIWTKTFGGANDDFGNSVQQTSDGGCIVIGYSYSFGSGFTDIYLIKVDVNGDTLWTKAYGGTGYDYGTFVQQTFDGEYVFTGTLSTAFGDVNTCLMKLDINGDTVWVKTFGGSDHDNGHSFQQTADGGFIITGLTESFGEVYGDVYLIKTDSLGFLTWIKTFGGSATDRGNCVKQTADGGYILSGYSYSFGTGLTDIYLIRTDANGDTLWSKTYGGSGYDMGYFIEQTSDGGFITAGYTTNSGTGDEDVIVIKSDINGDTLWTKIFGGLLSDLGYSIEQTTDGGYIITGSTQSFGPGYDNVYLIKVDSSGNGTCNERITSTAIIQPLTQVGSPLSMTILSSAFVRPSASQVNGGGNDSVLCMVTNVQGLQEHKFLIYPNPATYDFLIYISSIVQNTHVEIHNILNEKIFSTSFREQLTVNCEHWPSGIYFATIQLETEMKTVKLIKQ